MRIRWIPFAAVLAVVVVAAVWVASGDDDSPSRHAAAPVSHDDGTTHWSDAVAPVAHEVAKLRRLDFVHPVPVRFLDQDALARKLRKLTNNQVSRQESYAIGGFYDPDERSVFVLGDAHNPASQALLAHELTHVLQDQHFDTHALDRQLTEQRSFGVESDLLEGDAMLVFDDYAKELEANGSLPRWRAALIGPNVPAGPVSTALVQRVSPYLIATSALRVYRASSGGSTDNAFRHPSGTDAPFLTPSRFFDTSVPRRFPVPVLAAGDVANGQAYEFNALSTYLLLAQRLEPEAALRIADGWSFGGALDFGRGDDVCTSARFAGTSAAADAAFADGLARWAAAGDGSASATTDVSDAYGQYSTLTWCRKRGAPTPRVPDARHALMVPATRNDLEAEIADEFPLSAAACAADAEMDEPAFDHMVEDAERLPWRVPARVHRRATVKHLRDLAERCLPPVVPPLSQT